MSMCFFMCHLFAARHYLALLGITWHYLAYLLLEAERKQDIPHGSLGTSWHCCSSPCSEWDRSTRWTAQSALYGSESGRHTKKEIIVKTCQNMSKQSPHEAQSYIMIIYDHHVDKFVFRKTLSALCQPCAASAS